MRGKARGLWRNDEGAVAPTVALSLVALLATGGIAFDYARMASLDTELQNAADQAALSAATQLDQTDGSVQRATAAAQALIQNNTLFANESGASRAVTIPTVEFYATKGDAENDTNGFFDTTRYADAHFVRVAVGARQALFALTPIVGALSSGDLHAEAVAGLGSAICKVPPLMMCNPEETASNKDFGISGYVGRGLALVEGGRNDTTGAYDTSKAWGPGDFGYLQATGAGSNKLEYALGANNPPGDCFATDGVTTDPGEKISVVNAINTRFDIYQNGLVNDCTGTSCSPSVNTVKDVVHTQITTGTGNGKGSAPNCGFNTGTDAWQLPSVQYLPDSTTRKQPTSLGNPTNMGLPRDICHAVSPADCSSGRIGDGNWDRDLYFQVNYPAMGNWKTNASLTAWAVANGVSDLSQITRYQVYKWEIDTGQLAARLAYSSKGKDYYSYPGPQCAPGVTPNATQPDRRLTSMAVVNCQDQGVKGKATAVKVIKWVEAFFVEPSLKRDRTNQGDVYVEIVRVTDPGQDESTAGQVVRRDVPYLIK